MNRNLRKTLIFVLLLSLLSCSREMYKSRVNKVYKPLSAFKADTAKMQLGADTADYLIYNFEKNKAYYIGKKFEYLVQDLRLNIFEVLLSPDRYINSIAAFTFKFYFATYQYKRGVYCDILIKFQPRIASKDYYLISNYIWLWDQAKYDFFKDRIVKDISITDSRKWKR